MNIKKFKENVEKYMKLDKQTLAELLAIKEMLSNDTIEAKLDEEEDSILKRINVPTPVPTPSPTPITVPWPNRLINTCRNWTECTNPHKDCVNCPLIYGYNTYDTKTTPNYFTTTTPGNPNAHANTINSDESSDTVSFNNPSAKRFG